MCRQEWARLELGFKEKDRAVPKAQKSGLGQFGLAKPGSGLGLHPISSLVWGKHHDKSALSFPIKLDAFSSHEYV